MSDKERVDIDLGPSNEITVDRFIRNVVGNMFKMDNDVALLHTTLPNDRAPCATVVLELRVKEIYLDEESEEVI